MDNSKDLLLVFIRSYILSSVKANITKGFTVNGYISVSYDIIWPNGLFINKSVPSNPSSKTSVYSYTSLSGRVSKISSLFIFKINCSNVFFTKGFLPFWVKLL